MKGGVEARARRDRLAGVAVHVDDMQVGELGAQHVEVAQVRRRLEHPPLGGLTAGSLPSLGRPTPLLPLEELQHPMQIFIGRREVLIIDPGAVLG